MENSFLNQFLGLKTITEKKEFIKELLIKINDISEKKRIIEAIYKNSKDWNEQVIFFVTMFQDAKEKSEQLLLAEITTKATEKIVELYLEEGIQKYRITEEVKNQWPNIKKLETFEEKINEITEIINSNLNILKKVQDVKKSLLEIEDETERMKVVLECQPLFEQLKLEKMIYNILDPEDIKNFKLSSVMKILDLKKSIAGKIDLALKFKDLEIFSHLKNKIEIIISNLYKTENNIIKLGEIFDEMNKLKTTEEQIQYLTNLLDEKKYFHIRSLIKNIIENIKQQQKKPASYDEITKKVEKENTYESKISKLDEFKSIVPLRGLAPKLSLDIKKLKELILQDKNENSIVVNLLNQIFLEKILSKQIAMIDELKFLPEYKNLKEILDVIQKDIIARAGYPEIEAEYENLFLELEKLKNTTEKVEKINSVIQNLKDSFNQMGIFLKFMHKINLFNMKPENIYNTIDKTGELTDIFNQIEKMESIAGRIRLLQYLKKLKQNETILPKLELIIGNLETEMVKKKELHDIFEVIDKIKGINEKIEYLMRIKEEAEYKHLKFHINNIIENLQKEIKTKEKINQEVENIKIIEDKIEYLENKIIDERYIKIKKEFQENIERLLKKIQEEEKQAEDIGENMLVSEKLKMSKKFEIKDMKKADMKTLITLITDEMNELKDLESKKIYLESKLKDDDYQLVRHKISQLLYDIELKIKSETEKKLRLEVEIALKKITLPEKEREFIKDCLNRPELFFLHEWLQELYIETIVKTKTKKRLLQKLVVELRKLGSKKEKQEFLATKVNAPEYSEVRDEIIQLIKIF